MLNLQSDKIETVLAAHKAPARVWGGSMTPRTIRFFLAPAATTKLSRLESLMEEIALALGTPTARLTRANGSLSLEIPRSDSRFVSLRELDANIQRDEHVRRAVACAGTAILGLDGEGVPLLLRLSSPEVAHCLIAGTTGSGKTELARTIMISLAIHTRPRDVQLALFDPKAHSFASFAQSRHLLFPIVVTSADTLERMRYLVTEMERREILLINSPRLIVVIDELTDLLQTCGGELEALLSRLLQRGRSAGLSVIACTQKPTARAVGGLIKANFPVRLVGRVASTDDARVAAGIGGTGAEKLAGRGDFLLIAAGQIIRFQAAYYPLHQISELFASQSVAAPSERVAARVTAKLTLVK
jgi:DNA segregation ATPase FtsK/SpoIIIE, S-DNA-T family